MSSRKINDLSDNELNHLILFDPRELFSTDGAYRLKKMPDELNPHLRLAMDIGRFQYTYGPDGEINGIEFSAAKTAELLKEAMHRRGLKTPR